MNLHIARYIYLLVLTLISFVLVACANDDKTSQTNSDVQIVPGPTETSLLPASFVFKGTVSRDQIFEKEISQDLLFRLEPFRQDWEIWIGDKSQSDHNFSAVATPPFHGMNARYIEGWHFRNSDNSAPNEAGEKNVNAPQDERNFCYFVNEADYQIAYDSLKDQLLPSEEDRQQVRAKYSLLKPRAGVLRITYLELGNLVVGKQAWIEYMEFDVELKLSMDCELY